MRQLKKLPEALIGIMYGLLLAGPAFAQDNETPEADEQASQTEASEAEADTAAEEEIVVDDGSYIDAEDDDFKPSEEISADRSITFPTDI